MPRFADCISMLLHKRGDIDKLRTTTYFLTRGWINGEDNLDVEYERLFLRQWNEEEFLVVGPHGKIELGDFLDLSQLG